MASAIHSKSMLPSDFLFALHRQAGELSLCNSGAGLGWAACLQQLMELLPWDSTFPGLSWAQRLVFSQMN